MRRLLARALDLARSRFVSKRVKTPPFLVTVVNFTRYARAGRARHSVSWCGCDRNARGGRIDCLKYRVLVSVENDGRLSSK